MFSIHGEWKIKVHGNVLVQWFAGCWNEEAIIAYVKDFQDKASTLKGKEWAIVSSFEDWELGVPGIDKHIEEHCDWFKTHGCIKDCHIYTPNAAKEMQLERLIPHTDELYERQVFTNIEDAVAWLAGHNFNVSPSCIQQITAK